ncbi:hypothetical protein [Paenibacillus dendritiformis]|uniref:hypothetical protein n=1 Tax=Paenibacillus dendritiformis TaxID=130049 RepID=UPI001B2FFD99|nr:hypothetical protein [Paenibacillus dendritiformis]
MRQTGVSKKVHSGPRPDGDGVLYEPDRDSSGQYVFDPDGNPIDDDGDGQVENKIADILNDTNGFFHHEGNRPDSIHPNSGRCI